MKTKIFLTTAIFTLCVLLSACSENPMVTSDSSNKYIGENHPHSQCMLFWDCKNLSVSANGESFVNNHVVSPSLPGSIGSVKITFTASTNSKYEGDYKGNLSIFETGDLRRMPAGNDDTMLYSESDPKILNGYQELTLNISEGLIINGHGVKIAVSLFASERLSGGNAEGTYLELKDINIYTYPRN